MHYFINCSCSPFNYIIYV